MFKNFILPTGLLVGTIIGGGIFSLPFVFYQAGFLMGLIYLIVFAIISTIIHLMYADIILRTNDDHHRFPGYAEIYLGKTGGWIANLVLSLSLAFILLIYLILSASFFHLLFPGIPTYIGILIFWLIGTATAFLNVRKASEFETITALITIVIIAMVFLFGFPSLSEKITHLNTIDFTYLFLPLGPILFSLLGEAAIPPLLAYSKESNLSNRQLKKIIISGSTITILCYLLFVLGIAGLSDRISMDAVSGLAGSASKFLLIIIGIFGFVSLWDSYASIGTDIKKILRYDWKLPKHTANSIVIFLPLVLYFSGLQNFIQLISLTGGVLMSIWGILLVSVWQKASLTNSSLSIIKKIPSLVLYIITFIFIGAIFYEIGYFL